ncbi:hypothetical protein H2201_002781 [Coniosporium apollinis]|uniref:5'-3' DNA helicase ZGRF1-like N-terminal domain-containing protein n=2 Tax=Coniosporium TaxID=2810619 RepID=A0ABQ9NZ02_9PEZI|nr:hypothetical protein H2199_006599 [Cladosporium sp. JES 115]KAJ9666948.1 hypothetical protein H2201_002781 [Coniosporium apollinis]
MSTAVYSTPSLSVPPSQNTAPVIEFRCLYTHDVRRKQKRWQDGFLRFHTFNKRVMVYDIPRNYVGDHHWKQGAQLQEGDEVTLDKGVLVEVGEVVGTTETDLSPLFERKPKETPEKAGEASPAKAASSIRSAVGLAPPPLRHRSLNTLLGTPRGSLGRAILPTTSPYEARQGALENDCGDGPAAKRQRTGGNSTYTGWDVLRTTKASGSGSRKETPLWAKTSDARKGRIAGPAISKVKPPAGQARLAVKEVVDITSDPDDNFSDMTLPGTPIVASKPRLPVVSPKHMADAHPPRPSHRKAEQRIPRVPNGLTQRSSSPLLNKNDKPTAEPRSRPLPSTPPAQEDSRLPSSPPVSTTNKIHAVQNTIDKGASTTSSPTLRAANSLNASADSKQVESASNPRTKALRLSAVAPRKKMLLCETRSNPRQATSNSNLQFPTEKSRGGSPRDGSVARPGTPEWDFDFGVADERSASAATTAVSRNAGVANPRSIAKPTRKNVSRSDIPDKPPPDDLTTTAFDEMALVHGKMDERLTAASTRVKSALPRAGVRPGARPADGPRSRSPFRRVLSENDATLNPPNPSPGTASSEPAPAVNKTRATATKATAPPKRQLQRWKSLADAAPVRRVPTPPPPIVEDTDVGPWSTEAFDLFDWRPPNKDAEGNVIAAFPKS